MASKKCLIPSLLVYKIFKGEIRAVVSLKVWVSWRKKSLKIRIMMMVVMMMMMKMDDEDEDDKDYGEIEDDFNDNMKTITTYLICDEAV